MSFVDLHKKPIRVCVVQQERDVLNRRRFYCCQPERIVAFFGSINPSSSLSSAKPANVTTVTTTPSGGMAANPFTIPGRVNGGVLRIPYSRRRWLVRTAPNECSSASRGVAPARRTPTNAVGRRRRKGMCEDFPFGFRTPAA